MSPQFLALLPFLSLSPAGAQPSLVFSRDDVPALQQRIAGPASAAWAEVKARADAYCDRASGQYADPASLDAMPSGEVRLQVLGHTFGRKLTAWVEDLGLAYQLTGETRYGRQGVAVLMAAVERIPVTDPRLEKSFAGARGDIARGLAIGYDWLGELLAPEQKTLWAQVARGYVENILAEAHRQGTWWVPYHNFMGVAVGAVGCLALQLREQYPNEAPGWVEDAARLVTTWLDWGFDEQGAYAEGVLYSIYGLTNATLFAEALRRDGGPDLFTHPRLRQVPHFLAMSLLPGEGVFDARNDSSYAGLSSPLVLLMAERQKGPLARWLWDRCKEGTQALEVVWANDVAPADPVSAGEPLAAHFEGRGLCVFRTGWERGDVMLSVEAGPYHKVTHNQADKGSFTLYGLGERWAIDSGYGNNRQPGGRDQTVAHNCVLIDGEGQALSGAGAGTNGKILRFSDGPDYGYCLSDATDAYNTNSAGQPGATARRALRHTVFMRPRPGVPAYAVILDDIEKDDAPHDYTWMLHAAPNAEVEVAGQRAVIHPNAASGGAYVETPADATGQGSCEWRFAAPTQGSYTVWACVRAGGPEVPKSDSFFVQVDDGEKAAWHMPGSRSWTWGKVTDGVPGAPVTFDLEAGEHVLRFSTREAGAQVDRVAITAQQDAAPPFTKDGPAILLQAEEGTVSSPMVVEKEPPQGAPPRLVVAIHAAAPVALSVNGYDGHPRLNATTRAPNPRFAAVLLPLPADVQEPEVTFTEGPVGPNVRVQWGGGTVDEVKWPTEAAGAAEVVRR